MWDVPLAGWAIEARVYAEDPTRNFLPSIGRLVRYLPPTGAEDQYYIQFAPDGHRFAFAIRRAGKWAVEVRDAATARFTRSAIAASASARYARGS